MRAVGHAVDADEIRGRGRSEQYIKCHERSRAGELATPANRLHKRSKHRLTKARMMTTLLSWTRLGLKIWGVLLQVTMATFICGGIYCRSAAAQDPKPAGGQQEKASAPTDSSQSPRVSIDKSQFNLFNPTPTDAMRPFSTDRPGKTHSSLTVDAGHFQLEGDFWNYTWDHYTKDRTTIRSYTIANPNFKIGITNWAELDLFLPIYNSLNVRSRTTGSVARASGFGDVLVGGKVNFFGNDGGDQSFGAIAFIKLPTAARGLGNNMVEYALNLPFTTTLPGEFSLTLEPAVGLFRNINKQGYQGDYQFLINLNHPIFGETVTAALELALDFPGDHNIGPRHTLDPSLQWLVTPNLQLDVGVYIGLTKAAPDWNPYVGLSIRF